MLSCAHEKHHYRCSLSGLAGFARIRRATERGRSSCFRGGLSTRENKKKGSTTAAFFRHVVLRSTFLFSAHADPNYFFFLAAFFFFFAAFFFVAIVHSSMVSETA